MRIIFDAEDSEGPFGPNARVSDWSLAWFKDKKETEEPVQEIRLTIKVGEPTFVEVLRLVPKDRAEDSLDIPKRFEKYIIVNEECSDMVFKLLKLADETSPKTQP